MRHRRSWVSVSCLLGLAGLLLPPTASLWAAEPGTSQAKPFAEWRQKDFAQRGQIVPGPVGECHDQFRLAGWDKPTLLDLRRSVFYANEGGPFDAARLPSTWPTGDAFRALPELGNHEKYPLTLHGQSAGMYVLGGRVVGVQPRQLPWRIVKGLYDGDGIRIEMSGPMVVERMSLENVEDAFSPRGSGYWVIRGVHAKYIRDDFVENDGLLSGEIDDCLVDGAHVFLSARPGKHADPQRLAEKAKHPPVVKIRNTLVHLSPMPYDGDMKLQDQRYIVDGRSGGKLFKWSLGGGAVEVSDCVFRLDMMAPTGPKSMALPKGTYRNVTLVWLGEGDYPAEVPEGVTVTRDLSVWEKARDAWLKKHSPLVPPPSADRG